LVGFSGLDRFGLSKEKDYVSINFWYKLNAVELAKQSTEAPVF